MEGMLLKWTNYFKGWQPRWFILDNGILAYYTSEEDVTEGCKGSIKMSVCEIFVHPTDPTRVDVIIPGEQHFYLKCPSPQERQQWLVALGSAKACLTNTPHYNEKVDPQQKLNSIKSKRSELRLYSDLLMQQVQSVRHVANQCPVSTKDLDDCTSLLSETCDTLIRSLDECMKLINSSYESLVGGAVTHHQHHQQQQQHQHHVNTTTPVIPPTLLQKQTVLHKGSRDRRHSSGKSDGSSPTTTTTPASPTLTSPTPLTKPPNKLVETNNDVGNGDDAFLDARDDSGDTLLNVANSLQKSPVPSFFTKMSDSFLDLQLDKQENIPTNHFILSYMSLITLFDIVASSGFAPIKTDILGNLKSVRQKYVCDEVRYQHLQSMVLYELQDGTATQAQSATTAILWLKRSLSFIRETVYEVMLGQCEFSDALHNAYCKTIKPYHSSVIRAVFTMGMRSVPSRSEVITSLLTCEGEPRPVGEERERHLMSHIECYVVAVDRVISILHDFYTKHNIDFPQQAGNL